MSSPETHLNRLLRSVASSERSPRPRGGGSEGRSSWSKRKITLWVAGLGALWLLWFFRPWWHFIYIWLWKYPLVWLVPLCVFAVVGGITFSLAGRRIRAQKAEREREQEQRRLARERDRELGIRDYRSPGFFDDLSYGATGSGSPKRGDAFGRAVLITGVLTVISFVVSVIVAPMLTGKAIYSHYTFEQITDLPQAGQVRIIPKQVAETMAANGYSSSTENLEEAHIIRAPSGELAWSFQQAPGSVWRKVFSKTQGAATLSASSTAREFAEQDAEFETAPGQLFFDNVEWMAYKEHPLTDVAETTMILSGEGEPLLLAPYVSYEGFPVRVPVLGGVYVIHPDGEVEDLSPEEAQEREEIVESGRLFPESLARRIIDSYQYKNGILNRLFSHSEQIVVGDSESNAQPYLMDFGEAGTQWVATAEPWGRSYATAGVFLTDTVTGHTQLWQPSEESSLTGNQKVLDTVQGLAIPGIDFTDYSAVEPRPVFIDGDLHFLISIVPSSDNTVTKSVVVDAQTNKVTAVFDHDTDSGADEALIRYIDTGRLPGSAAYDQAEGVVPGDDGDAGDEETAEQIENLSDAEVRDLIDQLRQNQLQQDALIDELERRLQEK